MPFGPIRSIPMHGSSLRVVHWVLDIYHKGRVLKGGLPCGKNCSAQWPRGRKKTTLNSMFNEGLSESGFTTLNIVLCTIKCPCPGVSFGSQWKRGQRYTSLPSPWLYNVGKSVKIETKYHIVSLINSEGLTSRIVQLPCRSRCLTKSTGNFF